MLDIMFILLFFFALVMLVIGIAFEKNAYWNLVAVFVSGIVFLILGLSQLTIQIPYQIFNNTSGNIETGLHDVWTVETPYLTYLFFGFFAITQIYIWAIIWNYHLDKE